MHKLVWRLKANSPSIRLVSGRLVTCHEEIVILASLKETSN
jgi:hypothetical protein